MGNTCRGSLTSKSCSRYSEPRDLSLSNRSNGNLHQRKEGPPNPNPNNKHNHISPSSGMRRGVDPGSHSVLGHKTPNIRDLYTLGRKLGQGQFGTTYLCAEILTGIDYAGKSISKRKLLAKEDVEDVRREIQIMHHLSGHTNVVKIKGAYEDPLYVHIVME